MEELVTYITQHTLETTRIDCFETEAGLSVCYNQQRFQQSHLLPRLCRMVSLMSPGHLQDFLQNMKSIVERKQKVDLPHDLVALVSEPSPLFGRNLVVRRCCACSDRRRVPTIHDCNCALAVHTGVNMSTSTTTSKVGVLAIPVDQTTCH